MMVSLGENELMIGVAGSDGSKWLDGSNWMEADGQMEVIGEDGSKVAVESRKPCAYIE